jgi:hypothetical protein
MFAAKGWCTRLSISKEVYSWRWITKWSTITIIYKQVLFTKDIKHAKPGHGLAWTEAGDN